MQWSSCYCFHVSREVRINGVSFFWHDSQVISWLCHCSVTALALWQISLEWENEHYHRANCNETNPHAQIGQVLDSCLLRFYRNMLLLSTPEFNHSMLISKRETKPSLNPTHSFNITNPIYVQTSWFAVFHLSYCAVVFIVRSSSSTSFCRPTSVGKESVCCVGKHRSRVFQSFAASISHPGWWMKRTSGAGGWKCPHIGSQRPQKQRTMPLRWEAEKEQTELQK